MSRDPYYDGRGRGERWDSERFAIERDRARFSGGETRERFEERDSRTLRSPTTGRVRERSVDDVYERRGPRGFEEDRYESRQYYDEPPRFERERAPARGGTNITIEKEREVYSPSPPRREREFTRPAFLRRQSSLDTFDRKPLTRYVEREEYGVPARYREESYRDSYRDELYREDVRPPVMTPIPLPRTRALPPPRRYADRDYLEYDDIKVAEPDFYGDDEYRGFPERVREREIIRRRRRSRSKESKRTRSKESRASRSVRGSVKGSVRSSSVSSSSSDSSNSSGAGTVKNEFPKRGKTRMPGRLVNKRAIIDLGYPFEEEGDVVIIQKALGRENIDEVIKLSEDYNASEKVEIEMRGGRSEAGTLVEERRTTEVFSIPPPGPPPGWGPPPAQPVEQYEIKETIREMHRAPDRSPVIIDAGRPREEVFYESSDPIPVGPLALAIPAERHRSKDERAIRAEIKALEAEKEALRAEKRADKELRKAAQIRRGGRSSEGDLVLYDRETYERGGEEVTLVRREKLSEPEGGVRIEKDKKGRMKISVPKYIYD